MAEYIDREKIFPNGVFYVNAENPEASLNALINHICNLPTADVVPKSEYDNLKMQFDALDCECNRLEKTESEKYDKIIEAKAEVAREIFAEIERFLYMHFRFCKEEIGNDDTEYIKGRLGQNTQIQNFIAELKKKYTESENG